MKQIKLTIFLCSLCFGHLINAQELPDDSYYIMSVPEDTLDIYVPGVEDTIVQNQYNELYGYLSTTNVLNFNSIEEAQALIALPTLPDFPELQQVGSGTIDHQELNIRLIDHVVKLTKVVIEQQLLLDRLKDSSFKNGNSKK